MEFLTPEEVADLLKCSKWFVYQNRELLGGIKLGKIVRFEKEVLYERLQASAGEMDVRFLGEKNEALERRVRNKTGGKRRRSEGKEKLEEDERELLEIMWESS